MILLGSIKTAKELFESDNDLIDGKEIFVDREIQRNIFRQNIGAINENDSQLIYYAGASGGGKTALFVNLKIQSKIILLQA